MKARYFMWIILFMGVILVARVFYIAATYWPIGKSLRKSIEKSHEQYILGIFYVMQEERSLSVPIDKLHFPTRTSQEGEKKDKKQKSSFQNT